MTRNFILGVWEKSNRLDFWALHTRARVSEFGLVAVWIGWKSLALGGLVQISSRFLRHPTSVVKIIFSPVFFVEFLAFRFAFQSCGQCQIGLTTGILETCLCHHFQFNSLTIYIGPWRDICCCRFWFHDVWQTNENLIDLSNDQHFDGASLDFGLVHWLVFL